MTISDQGVADLERTLRGHVERGEVPGIAALVAHEGDFRVVTAGSLEIGGKRPVEADSVFRIASLTKPVAGAAAMILVEDGVIDLDDPVDKLLPELADRRVLRSIASELDDTVPADRAITIRDLLTFQLGFGFSAALFGQTFPIQEAEAQAGLMTLGPPWPPPAFGPDEWMARFATLPLMCQPGTAWAYNTGAQVLGILIERAAGRPFDEFLRDRIFTPLEMPDTAFHIRPGQQERMTVAYTHELELLDPVSGSMWSEPPAFPNGAGWLVSTVADYWSFVRMLSEGGAGVLTRESVEAMTTNHVPDQQRSVAAPFLGPTLGWGFCMAAPVPGGGVMTRPWGYGWNGGTGTTWTTDPETGLTGILFTTKAMGSPSPTAVFNDFWEAAYRALEL